MDDPNKRTPPQLPPLFDATPQSILQEAIATVTNIQALWDKVVSEVIPEDATVENVILPIAQNENETKSHIDIINFLPTVHPAADMREASKAARRVLDEAEVDLYLREDVFNLVDALVKKTNEEGTEPEIYRFLLKLHAQFLRNGCDLGGQARDQFKRDTKRFNELTKEYKSNLDSSKAGMWVTRADLEGLPTDFIDSLNKGEAENPDMLWVSMTRPHWSRILKFARSEDTRRRYLIQWLDRVPANVPLHREILLLRDSLARQKGWKSWAGFKMSDKMMKSPETVSNILTQMHVKLYEEGMRESEELLSLKRADVSDPATKLFFWDHAFYENARQEKRTSTDSKLTMEYFEVTTTVKNILSLYERLFDIEFELVTTERAKQLHGDRHTDITWQEDVFLYVVWDKVNDTPFLGYLYFDLHPRPGKYTHAGHYNLQKVRSIPHTF